MVLKTVPKTTLEVDPINNNIFIITLAGTDDHLLNPAVIDSFLDDLSYVKENATKGSVLITTAEGEYFSNGFDFTYATNPNSIEVCKDQLAEMVNRFKRLVSELISLPMPTIAAINGYARSAGLMLALSHDYLTMRSKMDDLCVSDLDRKMILPDYFTALIRSKVGTGGWSRFALKGLAFNSKDAKGFGLIVEPPGSNTEKPLETAKNQARQLAKKAWDGEVYAETRKALYPELCSVLGLSCAASRL